MGSRLVPENVRSFVIWAENLHFSFLGTQYCDQYVNEDGGRHLVHIVEVAISQKSKESTYDALFNGQKLNY